jgi:predicted ATPase
MVVLVCAAQVVMVAGYSGVGKTALVGQLKEVKERAYFISGKYDFNKRDVPYSAIVAAFTDMINQVTPHPPAHRPILVVAICAVSWLAG